MKKLINNFLNTYATLVKEDEEVSYIELMMDDHICTKWNHKLYYVPKNNSFYTENDELIVEFLTKCRFI